MAEANIAGHTNLSDEDRTRMCDPCKFGGVNTHAGTFCQVCSEYLCDTCEEVHRRFKATREHYLKPFDLSKRRSIQQNALIASVMTCPVHTAETLTLFCFSHDESICDRCNRTKHRRCKVKAVKEIAQEAQTRNDIALFLEKTRSLSSDMKAIQESRENDKIQIQISCRKSIQEVIELKLVVIKWIEGLAKDMEDTITDIEKKLMADAENDIKLSDELNEEIQEIINSFECLGNSNADAMFILMTKEKHKLDEGIEAKDDIMKEIQPSNLEFHKSDQLVTFMSDITSIGTFKTDDPISSDDSRICFSQISSVTRRDINIGPTSGVTGCVFMPDGRIVVCECNNSCSVKVFSQDFTFEYETNINCVWDMAVVSKNQVIVSQRYDKCLQFLNISGAIVKGKSIPVEMNCFGVDCKNNRIYVTCHSYTGQGGTVKILTMTGDTVNTFNVSQGYPYYLAVNSAGDRIVVSTYTNDVQCFDSSGTTLYTYSDSQLSYSLGLLFDSYDNLIVCGQKSNNLHVVNSDGTKQQIILTSKDEINQPHCLAYRPSDKTLIIGQPSKSILVFKINQN